MLSMLSSVKERPFTVSEVKRLRVSMLSSPTRIDAVASSKIKPETFVSTHSFKDQTFETGVNIVLHVS